MLWLWSNHNADLGNNPVLGSERRVNILNLKERFTGQLDDAEELPEQAPGFVLSTGWDSDSGRPLAGATTATARRRSTVPGSSRARWGVEKRIHNDQLVIVPPRHGRRAAV